MIINSAQGPSGKSKRFDLIRTWRDRIFFIGYFVGDAKDRGAAGTSAVNSSEELSRIFSEKQEELT